MQVKKQLLSFLLISQKKSQWNNTIILDMRLNPNHKLRKIGNRYMIVDVCTDRSNMTNVFYMNRTAAMLWQKAENADFTSEQCVEWLCENYEVDAERAEADVRRLLDCWRKFGLVLADE